MALLTIYLKNSNMIELNGLKDAALDVFQNVASVTSILYEPDGTTVVTTAVLTYVTSSNGIYRGTYTNSVDLLEGLRYRAQVTAIASQGQLVGFWDAPTNAITREG